MPREEPPGPAPGSSRQVPAWTAASSCTFTRGGMELACCEHTSAPPVPQQLLRQSGFLPVALLSPFSRDFRFPLAPWVQDTSHGLRMLEQNVHKKKTRPPQLPPCCWVLGELVLISCSHIPHAVLLGPEGQLVSHNQGAAQRA